MLNEEFVFHKHITCFQCISLRSSLISDQENVDNELCMTPSPVIHLYNVI